MNQVALMSKSDRSDLFHETAFKMAISDVIAEKDFWVCWILKHLFEKSNFSCHIIFKGGTSLSKVFGVIKRFSEDVDLILDWKLLGIAKEEPWIQRSKTKQDKYNKDINQKAQDFIKDNFLIILEKELKQYAINDLFVEIDKDDPFVINLKYPISFIGSYIRPMVRLEIGPLASWIPHGSYIIKPYAATYFPEIFNEPECKVNSIDAERTFWEKATILHQEAHRSEEKMLPLRFSRHYYDTYMLATSSIKQRAFSSLHLLKNVVDFKMKFYPCSWANYEEALSANLSLIPANHNIKRVEKDYQQMTEMIFGTVPNFKEIIDTLSQLEYEINSLKGNLSQ